MVRIKKRVMSIVPEYPLPAGSHLLQVGHIDHHGLKGIAFSARHWAGSERVDACWYEWCGDPNVPVLSKNLWIVASGRVFPGRYGDERVLHIERFVHAQSPAPSGAGSAVRPQQQRMFQAFSLLKIADSAIVTLNLRSPQRALPWPQSALRPEQDIARLEACLSQLSRHSPDLMHERI